MQRIKLILIGGTSHVGKSTHGKRLADELAWNYLSTDQLARHPGRPWPTGDRPVPGDVVEHYTTLSTAELARSVLQHYRRNVWPIIDAIVSSRLNNPFDLGLVLEGSAILPELYGRAQYPRTSAIWLTAPESLITDRIKQNSRYETGTVAERQLADAFLARTLLLDRTFTDAASANDQIVLDSSSTQAFETLRSLATMMA